VTQVRGGPPGPPAGPGSSTAQTPGATVTGHGKGFVSIPTPAWAVLFFCAWLTALLSITVRDVLPARFSYDGELVLRVAQGQNPYQVDRSYANTAAAYRLLGLQNSEELTALFGCAILLTALIIATTLGTRGSFKLRHLYVGLTFIVLGGVFLTWYNKDVFTLGVVIVTLLVLKFSPGRWWLIVATMAVYAAVFRSYWFLIAALTAGLVVLAHRRRDSPRRYLVRLFGLAQVFLILFCVAAPLVIGRSANTFRSDLNANREGAIDAVTIISSFVGGDSPVISYINAVLTQISLVIPWPLLMRGSQYVIYAVVIVALWMTLLVTVVRGWKKLSQKDRHRVHIGVSVLWATLTVQAIFEPDYGSYLRHLTPMLPLILAVTLIASRSGDEPPGVAATNDIVLPASSSGTQARTAAATPQKAPVEAAHRRVETVE
jgi:hypothetical protein